MNAVAEAPGESVMPYSGRWLDRAPLRRSDPAWLAKVRRTPNARLVPIWRDNCVVHGNPAAALGRCLLARHRNSVLGAYSTLAGFDEVGESLEDAVRREVAEEVGVRVGAVSYVRSQPWPFPAGLMVAFRATAETEAIELDH